jgi:hypothetical protein
MHGQLNIKVTMKLEVMCCSNVIGQTYWNGLCLMLCVYHPSSCRYEQREPNIREFEFVNSAIVQRRQLRSCSVSMRVCRIHGIQRDETMQLSLSTYKRVVE